MIRTSANKENIDGANFGQQLPDLHKKKSTSVIKTKKIKKLMKK